LSQTMPASIDFYTHQQAVHVTLGAAHHPTFGKGA